VPRPSKATHVLAKLREELGLHQRELAERVGLHWRTIQDIELGKTTLSRRNAIRISEKIGVSVDWLLQNDPSTEIKNVSGKRWSNKDRQALEDRAKRWPNMPHIIRGQNLFICYNLLRDYVYFRSILESLPDQLKAISDWRQCTFRALVEFLGTHPEAAKRESEISGRNDHEQPHLTPDSVQSIKDDCDAIADYCYSERPQDEITEAVKIALNMGWTFDEVMKHLDGIAEQNRKERLLRLYGIEKFSDDPRRITFAKIQHQGGTKADKEAKTESADKSGSGPKNNVTLV
jgi:transcriptional regulator with XRE-family HTH domain